MKKLAVFPGSFDPFTIGHQHIVQRGLSVFDEIIIVVGINKDKDKALFSAEDRIKYIKHSLKGEKRVKVATHEGLIVDFMRKNKISFYLRGIRNANDFEFEKVIAQNNRKMFPEMECVFIIADPEYCHIQSSVVRDIYSHGGDISRYLS